MPCVLWTKERSAQAEAVLALVRGRGVVYPRRVDAHFAYGRVRQESLMEAEAFGPLPPA